MTNPIRHVTISSIWGKIEFSTYKPIQAKFEGHIVPTVVSKKDEKIPVKIHPKPSYTPDPRYQPAPKVEPARRVKEDPRNVPVPGRSPLNPDQHKN